MSDANQKNIKQTNWVQAGQVKVVTLYDDLTEAAATVCSWIFPELQRPAPQPVVVKREERHIWVG